MYRYLLLSIVLLSLGCSHDEDFLPEETIVSQGTPHEEKLSPHGSATQIEIGALNAVKKAYQMTDLSFTPVGTIEANSRTYEKDKKYKGLIYSSVKEIGSYVGSNVSFHTFMTAIHNPRSKIYTERINEFPYHGTNCKAYYGTVCSGLVSYALGLDYGSYDFPVSELMEEVDFTNLDSLRIADVLWKSGHVAIITDTIWDKYKHISEIEISESVQSGCKRYYKSREAFENLMTSSFKSIYRYKELYKNTEYIAVPQFVAVTEETPTDFVYNNDLCVDKGDKSCYLEGEEVIVNIMQDYLYLEVYRGNDLYTVVSSTDKDVNFHNLPYGDYKARLCYGNDNSFSDYTYWKVVNIDLNVDRSHGRIYFNSANATPDKMFFASLSGGRLPQTQLFFRTLDNNDISRGYIEIPDGMTNSKYPFVYFYFSTDYGKIKNRPINWFD